MTYKAPQQRRTSDRVAAKSAKANPGKALDELFDDAIEREPDPAADPVDTIDLEKDEA